MTPNIKLGQPLTGNSVRHHLHRLHLKPLQRLTAEI